MTALIQALADELHDAAQSGRAIEPIRDRLESGGIDAAYAVQRINTRRALAAGRRAVGFKIGLTSLAVQRQLGVDQPDFGVLFADMAFGDGEEIPWARTMQAKAEAEVALVVARDLTEPELTLVDLIGATAYVLPAVEVVGSRIANWKIGILDTVADNASSGLFVLGTTPKTLAEVDLRLAGMVMTRRGEPVSLGAGAACLGHPLNAALWLARRMAQLETPLRAGDVVLTGALGPMVPVTPGDRLEARINGLGSLRVVFGKAAA